MNEIGFERDCSLWMKDWILETQALEQKDDPRVNYIAYAIEDAKTGITIGFVGCSYYDDMEKVGITYFIGADYRKKGYASEAVKAYVRYYFEHYNENEIIATIREENIASWKAMEKTDFIMTDRRMYKDIDDAKEVPYRFYSVQRS